jgi:magnesium-transporting ATPase (P-type)
MPFIILSEGFGALPETPAGEMPDLGLIIGALAFTIVLLMALLIINMLFTGGIIGMTKKAMDTGKTDSATGFDTVKKYFGNIIITSFVVGLIIAIGFALCCIPGILFCYWWMFALTIVVIEGVGLGEAMSRSKQFAETRHTFWFAVVLVIVIIVINFIASAITNSISWGLQQALGVWPGLIISTVIGQVFQWIIAPFAVIAVAVHYIKGRAPPVPIPPSQYPQPPYQQQPYQPPPQYPQDQYGSPPQ